jgi:methyl-accepting chemotaxis protein
MLDRMTVSALLRSVLLTTAFAVVAAVSLSAWSSWGRLQSTARIETVAEASSQLFRAMHNLRTDRTTTSREMTADQPIAAETEAYLHEVRNAELPALEKGLALLPEIGFPQQETLIPELDRLNRQMIAQDQEFWVEIKKPRAQRRLALTKEFMTNTVALLDVLDRLAGVLAATVNHQNATIDQLLSIKQAAWLVRNAGGEASLTVANGVAAGKITPEGRIKYWKDSGGTEAAWKALELATSGMQLPQALSSALAENKAAYFEPQFLAQRDRVVNDLVEGRGSTWSPAEYVKVAVGRLTAAVKVAEAALDEARQHAAAQHQAALRSLLVQLALLVIAILLTIGAIATVSRRVTGPLNTIRDAMLKVSAGDLTVETGYAVRRDEIGALAGALETFKSQAQDKLAIEDQERERNASAAARQRIVEACVGDFEGTIRETLRHLGGASDEMRSTSSQLSDVSRQTNARVETAQQASNDASMSVESVASAAEELSASIGDISRQAAHAAGIASRAVDQARQTDGTVQGLAQSAIRIGEVVGLINSIAAQTNLLALNATIEAARAGEAGRGFAVVASEVKTLASQTAKATDDISEQVAGIQRVANEAISAIKGIGGIISEVNEVATAIAAAVQQQGAATQEITRSTQYASRGTRNVSDNITGVKSDADSAAAAADNVKRASETLDKESKHLGGQVNDFLRKIRAA